MESLKLENADEPTETLPKRLTNFSLTGACMMGRVTRVGYRVGCLLPPSTGPDPGEIMVCLVTS